jgi:7,8-dihydropterin-6-yl-methyl-4-(beta-D-ribofuranosyl)aminobenzene 5'-phosphate synthase
VLPNTLVDYTDKGALACAYGHYTAAELQGKFMPYEHVHEHATCFNIRDKGLVVISSCGHSGIVNSVKQAQAVSGEGMDMQGWRFRCSINRCCCCFVRLV